MCSRSSWKGDSRTNRRKNRGWPRSSSRSWKRWGRKCCCSRTKRRRGWKGKCRCRCWSMKSRWASWLASWRPQGWPSRPSRPFSSRCRQKTISSTSNTPKYSNRVTGMSLSWKGPWDSWIRSRSMNNSKKESGSTWGLSWPNMISKCRKSII